MVAASQAVLVGKSMFKKTFVALDLALRVAAGMDWNGFPTKSGKVLYIAGEGSEDVRQRIKAWAKYHGTQPDNFYLIDEPIDFFSYDRREDGSNGEFGGLLKNLIMMDNVVLVVVDTFRTCFSGVENLSDDVSKYFKNARIINRRIGATVLTLHHPAKSGSTDARGAGNFLDDVDSYWSIDGNQTLKFRKVKGSPNPPSIKLQTNEFGGSLIVSYSAETGSGLGTPGSPKKTSANQNEQLALDCLQRLLVSAHEKPIPVKDWQEEYYRLRDGNKSTKATAFCRLKSSLLETGQITIHNDKVSLNIS